jgi:hypothetical protein
MATKQFGKLKVHWSKRGIAYKWGDGEIHRLSFERQAADSDALSAGGYDSYGQGYDRHPQDQGYAQYDEYGRGYDAQGEPYGAPGGYQDGGYYPEDMPPGRYDVLYASDWPTWAALVLLPPLGIWLLWRRERLEPRIRIAVSAAAAVWFIVLLVWLFSSLFSRGADQTVNVGNTQQRASIVVGTTQTPAPTIAVGDLDAALDDADQTSQTPAPGAGYTPRPDSAGVSDGAEADDGAGDLDDGADEDEDTTYVWATNTGSYYHRAEDCSEISGTAGRVAMDIARSRGQTACPVCYGDQDGGSAGSAGSATYYANKGGRYYHTKDDCSGMKNAQAVTRSQATKAGKKPCPVCIGAYFATPNGKYYHTKSNCSGMSGAQPITQKAAQAAGKAPCPTCVAKSSGSSATKTYYSNAGGKYYHVKSNCSGMKNAQKVTAATIKKRNQTACPICIGSSDSSSSSGTVYYATTAGKYYHTKSNCSGMKNARKITQATAKTQGKEPCPVCVKSSSTTYVYATTAGKHYHKTANCSGMKNARKVTMASAKSAGKTACPVCLSTSSGTSTATKYYSTVGGKYYHKTANCSGMKNATRITQATAKERKQSPCPVCLSTQAQSAKEGQTYVYATTAGKYYHAKGNCSGMKNARKVTMATAKGKGKTACPVCMKAKTETSNATYVYATQSGQHYHKKGCGTSDAKNAKKVALATAKKYGKTPCPTCFRSQTIYVYVTPAGLRYHGQVTCGDERNTMKITLKTALDRKYTQCPDCDAPKP